MFGKGFRKKRMPFLTRSGYHLKAGLCGCVHNSFPSLSCLLCIPGELPLSCLLPGYISRPGNHGSHLQVNHLKGWVRNSFASLAMVNYPYPASFLAPLPGYPVKTSCQIIMAEKNHAIGLAQGAGKEGGVQEAGVGARGSEAMHMCN